MTHIDHVVMFGLLTVFAMSAPVLIWALRMGHEFFMTVFSFWDDEEHQTLFPLMNSDEGKSVLLFVVGLIASSLLVLLFEVKLWIALLFGMVCGLLYGSVGPLLRRLELQGKFKVEQRLREGIVLFFLGYFLGFGTALWFECSYWLAVVLGVVLGALNYHVHNTYHTFVRRESLAYRR